jgi:hypothetical protein
MRAGLIKGFVVPGSDVSSVSITYSYDIPKLINFPVLKKIRNSCTLVGFIGKAVLKTALHKRTP